jgi:hypothetical protein
MTYYGPWPGALADLVAGGALAADALNSNLELSRYLALLMAEGNICNGP